MAGNLASAPSSRAISATIAMVKGGGLEEVRTDSEVYRCKGGNQLLASKLLDVSRRRVHAAHIRCVRVDLTTQDKALVTLA